MTWTNYLSTFRFLWESFGYFRKAVRLKNDWAKVIAEWNRIGGFKASTEKLLNFLSDFSLYLVEYATWTKTDIDDQFAKIIRNILVDHRDILETIIETIRGGHEISATQLSAMATTVSDSSDEYSSPMTAVYILSLLYHALLYLKSLHTDDDTKPIIEPPTPEPNRPVLNFIRTIFGKK